MKLSINSRVLEKLLSRVIPAIPQRTPMQLLENFLFEIEDNMLTVTATDLEIFLRAGTNVDAGKNWSGVVEAKLLYDTVRSLGDTLVVFETGDSNRLKLKTDNGEYYIGYGSADEYPHIPVITEGNKIILNGARLRRALEQTSFAVSKESMRPAMTGILFEFTPDGLRFVATDGHRLVKYTDKAIQSKDVERYILPERSVAILTKLLGEGDVNLYLSDTNLAFDTTGVEMVSRIIGQKYPDYNSVIPIENDKRLTLQTGEIKTAIRRMLLFSTATYQQVKLSVRETELEVSSQDIEKGSFAQEHLACSYDGDPMDLGFNTTYLNDMLNHMEDGQVVFKLHSPTKAVIMEPVQQKEQEELLMLLMPVRLNM